MGANFYVYGYLLISALYVAGCIAYINAVSRTASLTKERREADSESPPRPFASDAAREETQSAVRCVLAADSAAFACAVIPVAYAAVTGLLANLIARNTAVAGLINPLWLAATVVVLVAHMIFLSRIVNANSKLKETELATFTPTFVSRHVSMLTYYRIFMVVVIVFTTLNSIFLVVNIETVTSLHYVM
jgi:hypothetical protein